MDRQTEVENAAREAARILGGVAQPFKHGYCRIITEGGNPYVARRRGVKETQLDYPRGNGTYARISMSGLRRVHQQNGYEIVPIQLLRKLEAAAT